MGEPLLVSVIIPVFNVSPYLCEALDSVVNQSYSNIEIIIIDDGSTDKSGEVCDEYAKHDTRIKVIHQENQGLSAARNVGLDTMTGDAVAFLDPDDAYESAFIQRMVSAKINNDADLVICRYTNHNTKGKISKKGTESKFPLISKGLYDRMDTLRAVVDKTINVSVWNKLYCRRLWRGVRFPNGHVAEDRYTTFSILGNCNVVCVLDDSLYLHRKRPGSITQTASLKKAIDKVKAFDQFQEYVEKNTPAVFDYEQLQNCRREHYRCLLSSYAESLRQTGKGSDEFSEELIKRIISDREKVKIQNCSITMRAIYRMICVCPWLLKYVYIIYKHFAVLPLSV